MSDEIALCSVPESGSLWEDTSGKPGYLVARRVLILQGFLSDHLLTQLMFSTYLDASAALAAVVVAMSSMGDYIKRGTCMNNPHDDDLAARLREVRARPHWTWSEEDMDDLATASQLATLDRMIEKYQARKKTDHQ